MILPQIEAAASELVVDHSLIFRDLYFSQSATSQRLLSAIAAEGEARNVFSASFLQRHDMPAASSVRSALKSLTEKDIVYRTERGYMVYDRIFGEWLRRI